MGTQISNSLRSIQSNLLSGDVDVSYIEKEAREIFEKFQAAEDTLNAEDTVYQAIMTGLDSFMRNIQKYAEVQKSEQGLNQLINHLQQGNDKIDNSWKIIWLEELENLKSEIGGLPSYTGTESQMLLLYDRINEINKLDNALRMYISEHNAADQAMIYLFIPYRGLAVLSFLLALFLDISAFVTGFIIDIVDRRQMRKQTGGSSQSDCYDIEKNTRIVTEEFAAVPSTAQRYIFVTGDYTKEDGKYYYKALEGGELTEVNGQNLQMGFYVEISGKFCAIVPQELAFLKTHNGPQDGVYYNCYLQYSDNMLSIKNNTDEEYHYLATMNDSVPVYQIRNNECIIQDACDIPPQDWEIIIVALNAKGTQVAAIYLM